MKNILIKILGLLLFSASLTVLYEVMSAISAVGGSCAEGGPYLITTPCPGNTAVLAPLSIFAGLAGFGMYFWAKVKNSPDWRMFFWTALFVSQGWNFLQSGITSGGADIASIVCAVVFFLMGAAPLVSLEGLKGLSQVVLGSQDKSAEGSFLESRVLLFALHVLAATVGVYLGLMVVGA